MGSGKGSLKRTNLFSRKNKVVQEPPLPDGTFAEDENGKVFFIDHAYSAGVGVTKKGKGIELYDYKILYSKPGMSSSCSQWNGWPKEVRLDDPRVLQWLKEYGTDSNYTDWQDKEIMKLYNDLVHEPDNNKRHAQMKNWLNSLNNDINF